MVLKLVYIRSTVKTVNGKFCQLSKLLVLFVGCAANCQTNQCDEYLTCFTDKCNIGFGYRSSDKTCQGNAYSNLHYDINR